MVTARQFYIPVISLKNIKPHVYIIRLQSSTLARRCLPGQFLHVKVDKQITILRRPLSIHKVERDTLSLLFRVRGRGTELLSRYKKGDILDIIGPLGNGFNFSPQSTVHSPQGNILVAGGMGVAPLVFLAQKLKPAVNCNLPTTVLLGAKNKKEVLAEQEFKKCGFKVRVATDDGSRGFRGTVTQLLENILATSYRPQATSKKTKNPAACSLQPEASLYACGPQEMFKEIRKVIAPYPGMRCQVSFEQFMGCGVGICCGCVIQTQNGYKKVCKDGPVFDIREVYA